MNDAGRIGFLIRGDYSATETYNFLDVVYYEGSSYVAKKITIGNTPNEDNEYWHIFAKGSLSPVTGVKGDNETTYRDGYVNLTAANVGAVPEDGDIADNIVSFTSGDSNMAESWTNVSILSTKEKISSAFGKVSTMFKNIRYLYKMLGTTNISDIGGGTVTGAISALNTDLSGKAPSSHTHTKAQVGLGNVDNTADKDKSVNYANSAGSAGSATSASKLGTDAGNSRKPVYFSGGKPIACDLIPLFFTRSGINTATTTVDGTNYYIPLSGFSGYYMVTQLSVSKNTNANGKRMLVVEWYADGSKYVNTIAFD